MGRDNPLPPKLLFGGHTTLHAAQASRGGQASRFVVCHRSRGLGPFGNLREVLAPGSCQPRQGLLREL